MNVNLDLIYGNNVTRHDNGYYTTGQEYLNQMDLGQHFVQVCAHSYSGGHHFGTKPTKSASYANVYIHSPTDRAAKLLIGCDDGIKIWLNGKHIYTNDRYGGWIADRYKIDVNLTKGWNNLLCKISQLGGDYKFSARFTDSNYITLDDIEYQINNPDNNIREAKYIRSWLLNGFHQDNSDNFYKYLTTNYIGTNEAYINPNEGDIMGGKTWIRYNSGNPYINIGEYSNDADFGVCYAYVDIYANTQKSCQLWMGYEDGARIWLNGEEILYDNRYGNFISDFTKVNVTLNSGENHLLVKVSEWMGNHGFSARLCESDGSEIKGISYIPESTPITFIGTWLLNGPYLNLNQTSRLETDYLNGENFIKPSENDIAPINKWERAVVDGIPIDLASFFDDGDWVFSETIQQRDPPVLFYNLFSCGPGRFTDENYLAGSYIFHTTYGLITIASAKSGSMLYFDDFTEPIGKGKSFGEAFYEWFNAQAPFAIWEKEWYYGMVLCGDPTLKIIPEASPNYNVSIIKPNYALYFKNNEIIPFFVPTIIGEINIEVNAINENYEIDHVDFFIDNQLISIKNESPYEYYWDEKKIGRHVIKVIAYDENEKEISDEISVLVFNLNII
jgi:hypothetical protein